MTDDTKNENKIEEQEAANENPTEEGNEAKNEDNEDGVENQEEKNDAQPTKIKENKPEEGAVIISDEVSDDAKWYVVHTYAGHEKKVATTLKQRVRASGYTDRIFQIFIPHQQKIVISEGKKRSVNERLFPGYVVVLMEMSDDAWLLVRSTPGVTGFVGMGSTPTPLPEQEVKTLMKFAKMEAPKFEAKYSVGDSVKIIDGPFRDILGKVEEVNEDQGKVKVLISSFGREVPVELDFVQVQSI